MTLSGSQSQTEPDWKHSAIQKNPSIGAVDLFCGIGGLTHRLRSVGIDVALGIDIDQSCRFAYEVNNPGAVFLHADIRDITFSDLKPCYEQAEITALVGCAPCQPF